MTDPLSDRFVQTIEDLEARLVAAREVIEAVDIWLWNEELAETTQ